MFKAKAPQPLIGAVEKSMGKWPKCKCGYPCEVRSVRIFAKDGSMRRASLACVADECEVKHTVLFKP